jgi:hypothetical protein
MFALCFSNVAHASWGNTVISSWEGESSKNLTNSAWSFPDQVVKIESENRSVFVYNRSMTNGYGNNVYSCEVKFVIDDIKKKIESGSWSATAMPTVTYISSLHGDACSYHYSSLRYLAPKAWEPKVVSTGASIVYKRDKPFLIFRDQWGENFEKSQLKFRSFTFPKAPLLKLDEQNCLLQKCEFGNNARYEVTIGTNKKNFTFEVMNYLYPEIYFSFKEGFRLSEFMKDYRDKILPFSPVKQKNI